MYFIETKATSCLPYFGNLLLSSYLSVVCRAAVATELSGITTHSFLQICFKSKMHVVYYSAFVGCSSSN
jgi:hypothetical protein